MTEASKKHNNASDAAGTKRVFKAAGAGVGIGAAIGIGIAALVNTKWTANAEKELSQQLHQLLNRANQATDRIRRNYR